MFVSRRNAVEKWRYARALSRPWCTRIPFHELPLERLTRSMPTRPCRPVAASTQSTLASSGTGLASVALARAGTASLSHDRRVPVKRPARANRLVDTKIPKFRQELERRARVVPVGFVSDAAANHRHERCRRVDESISPRDGTHQAPLAARSGHGRDDPAALTE